MKQMAKEQKINILHNTNGLLKRGYGGFCHVRDDADDRIVDSVDSIPANRRSHRGEQHEHDAQHPDRRYIPKKSRYLRL
jgi:hypothetical protein